MAKRAKKNANKKREQQGEKAAESRKTEDDDNDDEIDSDNDDQAQQFDEDDESIDDDEAFNSDDERKYGDFFHGDDNEEASDSNEDEEGDSDEDENDDSSDDDDNEDEEGDGGQYMLDLLDKLDSSNDNDEKKKRSDALALAAAAAKVSESEFATSVLKKGNLTLDSLMDGLQDTKGFGTMQKSLKKISEGETTQVPVAKVISKRAERKVHYDNQTQEVSRWIEAVQQNRQAESLDFRPKERLNVTRENLIEKFVPTTDFEKAVHAALEEAGQQDEEAILKAEEAAFLAQQKDDLGGNEQTLEEFRKRRSELAKMRALMFYHEQARHRINKIKSKKYRRIRKKQRERAKESEMEAEAMDNPDLLKELEEKEEYDRMKERMTLAHKNTSKWAKRILKRGKNVDTDTRRALSAQLKRGDDLRKKMNEARGGGDSDDSENEDLVDSARKVLQETEEVDDDEQLERKGLFKLKFMQKGIEKQREQAKEEARQLLRELEANEKLDDYDEAVRYDESGDEEDKKKPKKVASTESMKQVLNEGELVASSLKFGRSNAIATSGGIEIDLGIGASNKDENRTNAVSEYTSTLSAAKDTDEFASPIESGKSTKKKRPRRKKRNQDQDTEDNAEVNPWIGSVQGSAVASDHADTRKSSKKQKTASAMKTGVVDVDRVLDVLDDGAKHPEGDKNGKLSTSQRSGGKKDEPQSITMLSQEELVRRAFASSSEKEVEEEFAREKAEVEDEENDTKTDAQMKKEKAMATVSGWGSWAGAGAPPPRPPLKLPKHLQPPPKKEEPKRKRQDSKYLNVIIREKRQKQTANNYMLDSIPYPFSTREEYERAMRGAVGKEWNVTKSVKDMTRPEIQTRPGKIIQPLSQKVKKQHRAPAKF